MTKIFSRQAKVKVFYIKRKIHSENVQYLHVWRRKISTFARELDVYLDWVLSEQLKQSLDS